MTYKYNIWVANMANMIGYFRIFYKTSDIWCCCYYIEECQACPHKVINKSTRYITCHGDIIGIWQGLKCCSRQSFNFSNDSLLADSVPYPHTLTHWVHIKGLYTPGTWRINMKTQNTHPRIFHIKTVHTDSNVNLRYKEIDTHRLILTPIIRPYVITDKNISD